MKYQSEYQRNYQRRVPRQPHELTAEERKLGEVPVRRAGSSPSRRRTRAVPASRADDGDFALLGPNEKFAQSQLYRMKQPVKDQPRVAKSQEFALLGKNAKFENNTVYPLRKPVQSDSPRVIVRRPKVERHSCGIQANLKRATSASLDHRHRRHSGSQRRRDLLQTEYKEQYNWKQNANRSLDDLALVDDRNARQRRAEQKASPPVVDRPAKASVAVNTPARVAIDVNRVEPPARPAATRPAKNLRPQRDNSTEYRARYKPILVEPQQRGVAKAFEAEEAYERARQAHSDNEGAGGAVDLGTEFRQNYPHGKLRRWKSEYQSTYKPFWRFDYKNGKWYKDTDADDKGFNPKLFWYKELMSTRQRADEFRTKAETDHFHPGHTLQLQAGLGQSNYQAWDVEVDGSDESDSVVSVDRTLERERIEGARRREKDAKREEPQPVRHEKPQRHERPAKPQTDRVAQTDHRVDRVIYVDEPPARQPSAATKAFVRNLGSSSVQQHMSWDSDSFRSQPTDSDIDSYRRPYTADHSAHRTNATRRASPSKRKSRGTGTHSPLPSEQPARRAASPQFKQRTSQVPASPVPQHDSNGHRAHPVSQSIATTNATGRPSYDSYVPEKRPQTSANEYCTYPGSRFKDEVTDYYYGAGDYKYQPPQSCATPSKHFDRSFDEHYGRTYNAPKKDDDVLSVNSVRSLSSSCSLASQTLERAHKNMNKYWGDNASPKKLPSDKH